MTIFHDVDFVIDIHHEQLKLHGGAVGTRDPGMLESAIARPLQKAAYGDPDLCQLAAAYLYGIVRNHPFVDGNKRTGFVAADVFLALNGLSLEAPQEDVVAFVLGVAAGEIDEDGATRFFRDHVVPIAD
ncbi:type II toxin-antitoxin system death-on-curing family toxin [Rhizobium sp. EC-SD404]|uniref:type II toxin-antitoxin system death-on-curing family toxin n=1 Tax=Rhizobium sp. EC-SD404 TaxID=2038389 RepID=UPI0012529280|nr:type II toxin-antitoxin system death-on-curing family toxin [Rhizobium sp. EC-SD404]VVT13761.1 Death on curing protein [Rhizobium sp. EC-SD404]